jgi:hypothetical protein
MSAAGRLALLLIVVAIAAACDDPAPGPSPPGAPTSVTDEFVATLSPGGSSFFSFAVFEDGSVRLTLASVTDANGTALSPTLRLGLGIPSGTGCATFTEVVASPGLLPHIDGYGVTPGTYCVRVADAGGLGAVAAFFVRLTYPNPPNITATDRRTETFSSTLTVNGSASRTITASQAGTLEVTLQSLDGAISHVGFGVGVIRQVDGTCAFTRSAQTGAGERIVVPVVAGTYCVRIFDVGGVSAPAGFSIQLSIP